MTCAEAREQLEMLVLGGLSPAQAADVESHLAACPTCRAAVAEYRLLLREIKRGASAAPTPAVARAVREAIAAQVRARRRRVRIRPAAAVVGSAAALLLIGLAAWHTWPLPGGSRPPAARPGQAGSMPERWRYRGARSEPASAADGVVVRGTSMYLLRKDERGAHVAAIDAATGEPRWRSELPSHGYLAADDSAVYCLAARRRGETDLVALDAGDGKTMWRYSAAGRWGLAGPCRPVPVAGGRVCWTTHGRVQMIDAKMGRPMWARSIAGEGPLSCAAVDGEDLYVVSAAALHCLEVETGRKRWRRELETPAPHAGRPLLALARGMIFFVLPRRAGGSRLVCMDAGTGRLNWQRATGEVRHLLAGEHAICLRGADIRAFDDRTGQPLWRRAAGGCGPLTRAGGLIHFVDSTKPGRLVALDERTGMTAWEIAGIRSCDAFRRIGRTGYIKTCDGIVHAIALRTY